MMRTDVDVLDRVAAEMRGVARSCDVDALDGAAARAALGRLAEIERAVDALRLLVIGRVDRSGAWAATSHRSLGTFVAAVSGTTVGAANAIVQTAMALRGAPAVEAALRDGALSLDQTVAIVPAAVAAPDRAEHLVATATSGLGVRAIKDEAARVLAAARPKELDAAHAQAKRERHLRMWQDGQRGYLQWQGTLDAYGRIKAHLATEQRRVFRDARRAGRREPVEAYGADALERLITQPAAAGSAARDVTMHVLVSLDALRRGHVDGDERCEIAGVGPVPVRVAREYLTDAFLTVIIKNGVDIASITHVGRRIPAALRTALVLRGIECIVEGCNDRGYLETDHHVRVADGGPTSYQNCGPACRRHNLMKEHGYTLGPPDPVSGKRPLYPPGERSRSA